MLEIKQAPKKLYVEGNASLLNKNSIAIIGARRCSKYGAKYTAKFAKENGYDSFSTTLLVSPYQNHEALKQVGEELAEKYGLEFVYRDFRVGFREGQTKARELGLYMQKYCGCVFSEEDRYSKQISKNKEIHE